MRILNLLLLLLLFSACAERRVLDAIPPGQVPDSTIMATLYEEVKTPHKYGIVLREEGKKLDCPSVFRYEDKWYMIYIVFDGTGYETAIASSEDLLHWKKLHA